MRSTGLSMSNEALALFRRLHGIYTCMYYSRFDTDRIGRIKYRAYLRWRRRLALEGGEGTFSRKAAKPQREIA